MTKRNRVMACTSSQPSGLKCRGSLSDLQEGVDAAGIASSFPLAVHPADSGPSVDLAVRLSLYNSFL